jgi:hypothetical protein
MMNRLSRWMPLAGVLYTVLLALVLFATPSTPDSNAGPLKVIDSYASHRGGLQVATYLLAYTGIALVVFFAVLSGYLRRRGADVTARVMLIGATVMAAGYGIAAGTNAMIGEKTAISAAGSSAAAQQATAHVLNLVNDDLPFIALLAGGLLAMIAVGVAVLNTRVLPTWMGWVAIVAGVANGVGTFVSFIGLMLGALWILVASVMLYQRMNAESGAAMPTGGSSTVPAQGMSDGSNTRVLG